MTQPPNAPARVRESSDKLSRLWPDRNTSTDGSAAAEDDVTASDEIASQPGTFALVPQVVDAVGDRVPVVAAGGIVDGRVDRHRGLRHALDVFLVSLGTIRNGICFGWHSLTLPGGQKAPATSSHCLGPWYGLVFQIRFTAEPQRTRRPHRDSLSVFRPASVLEVGGRQTPAPGAAAPLLPQINYPVR